MRKINRLITITLSILLALLPPLTNSARAAGYSQLTLIANRAIAAWPDGIPGGEKRPVIVFLPGWGGSGAVNASISGQNLNFINSGYVTLAIGFDSSAAWISDIEVKTLQGLNNLCSNSSIPADCDAILLVGSSYGGAQNYWVIEHLRANGFDGTTGKALGFISEDAGYGAPGNLLDSNTGEFQCTGLADANSYSIAMIENLGDSTFPVDACTWGNCGARTLSAAHLSQGDENVFSMCPAGGEHGTRGYADWNAWVNSAAKKIIHDINLVPAFTGYTPPALNVANTCLAGNSQTFLSISAQDGTILESSETSKKGGSKNSTAATLNLGDDSARRQYLGILSFDTTLPANAQIISATLKVRKAKVIGGKDPLNLFGGFIAQVRSGAFGKAGLAIGDFQSPVPSNASTAAFKAPLVNGWYSIDLGSVKSQINSAGITQIRLKFKVDDNNNSTANYLKLYSGNAGAASAPQLVIEYYVP